MKRIAILGSTGSIGCSALSVVESHQRELKVVGLAAGENVARFVEQVKRHQPGVAALASSKALEEARSALREAPGVELAAGADGLLAVATHPDADIVLCATSGTAGLDAVLAAIALGKTIALANKEVLVMAGSPDDGGGSPSRRDDPSRRQRAQRHSPVSARSTRGGRPASDLDRVWWTVS